MSNLNLQKLREWVWPWLWTFKLHSALLWECKWTEVSYLRWIVCCHCDWFEVAVVWHCVVREHCTAGLRPSAEWFRGSQTSAGLIAPSSWMTAHTGEYSTVTFCSARNLRSSTVPLLYKPTTRTRFADRAFRCTAPTVWNSLAIDVTSSCSLTAFKSRLKTHIFRQTFNLSD